MSGTPQSPYTLREARWRWLSVIALQLAVGVAVFLLAAQDASHVRAAARALSVKVDRASERRSQEKLVELRAQCDRGNVQRAWDVTLAPPGRKATARGLFPLLDCYATMYRAHGASVLLAPSEARRFMVLVRAGRTPVVDAAGRVRR